MGDWGAAQATRPDAYWLYFHNVFYFAPLGFGMQFTKRTDAKWFLVAYTLMSAYFSRKMVRPPDRTRQGD